MTTERIAPIDTIERAHGRYELELFDAETGELQERHVADNYVSPAQARAVRWWQGAMFHNKLRVVGNGKAGQGYGPSSVGISADLNPGAAGYFDEELLAPPVMGEEALVAAQSNLAEAPTSEWGTGRTTAYATRWRTTVPASGKRGQINESQSGPTNDTIKLVWDFNETQGVGPIGSLMLGRVDINGNLVLPRIGYEDRITDTPPQLVDRWIDLVASSCDANYHYAIASNGGSTSSPSDFTVALFRIPRAGGTDQGTYQDLPAPEKVTDLAFVQVSTSSGAGTETTLKVNSYVAVVPVGADYVMAWPGDDGSLYAQRFTSAGTPVWASVATIIPETNSSNTSTFAFLVNIGTHVYAATWKKDPVGTAPEQGPYSQVHRLDAATGLNPATISIGQTCAIRGLCNLDSGNLGIWIDGDVDDGLWRYDVGGSPLDFLGNPSPSNYTETLETPWPNNQVMYRYDLWNHRDNNLTVRHNLNEGYRSRGGTGALGWFSTRTAIFLFADANTQHRLHMGCLRGRNSSTGESFSSVERLGGSNIFSRTALGSIVNKSSSQTAKITYTLTLPSSWRDQAPHGIPPAPPATAPDPPV